MIDASRPSTRPSASISSHFLSISDGLAEKVFIARGTAHPQAGFSDRSAKGGHVSDRSRVVKRSSLQPAGPRFNMPDIRHEDAVDKKAMSTIPKTRIDAPVLLEEND